MQEIRQQICFPGSLPNREIAAHMAAADYFVFSSKTETQGIVILEAMAARTSVVALRASGVEDLVEDGISGYLCPEKEEAFTEQLLRVLQSEPLRNSLWVGAFEAAFQFRFSLAFGQRKCYNQKPCCRAARITVDEIILTWRGGLWNTTKHTKNGIRRFMMRI